MTIPCYKGSKFNDKNGLLQEWQLNNDKFNNNNEDKLCLFL